MAIHTKRIAAREYNCTFELPSGDMGFSKGYSTRDVCLYRQPSFSGAMRKYAGWKHETITADRAVCDAAAAYKAPTVARKPNPQGVVLIRKART